jgi:hypothetical protein
VKPKPLPKSLGDAWKIWPTLEELHDRNKDQKLHAIRAMLAPVLCYRCKDNTVRYQPELAEAALLGQLPTTDEDDEDDDDDGDELSDEIRPGKGKMVDVMMLVRELARCVNDARKEKNDTIKAMETPLKVGVSMMTQAMEILVTRNAHYESIHDEMILQREQAASQEFERLAQAQKLQQNQEMRRNMFGLLREQVPAIVSQFQSATEAKIALELVRSFEGPAIDAMLEFGGFSPEQQAMIARLRKTPPRPVPKPGPEQAPSKDDLAAAS